MFIDYVLYNETIFFIKRNKNNIFGIGVRTKETLEQRGATNPLHNHVD